MQDPTEHPKGPQRDPKNNESRRYGGPFWAPLAACKRTPKGPPRHPWGTEGAAKTAPNENSEPLNKKHRGQEKDNKKHTPNPIAIYEGFALLPFGGAFWETPRHEENTKTIILLQFRTPRGATTLENPVFYEGS